MLFVHLFWEYLHLFKGSLSSSVVWRCYVAHLPHWNCPLQLLHCWRGLPVTVSFILPSFSILSFVFEVFLFLFLYLLHIVSCLFHSYFKFFEYLQFSTLKFISKKIYWWLILVGLQNYLHSLKILGFLVVSPFWHLQCGGIFYGCPGGHWLEVCRTVQRSQALFAWFHLFHIAGDATFDLLASFSTIVLAPASSIIWVWKTGP